MRVFTFSTNLKVYFYNYKRLKFQILNILFITLIATSCNKTPEVKLCNESFEETIIDERDGQSYDIVKIGDQVWMAENLNYSNTGRCYDYLDSLCNIYGRLYTWHEILNNEEYIYNESQIRGICPSGFHIPSIFEWREMINYVGGYEEAQYNLLNPTLWNHSDEFELTNEFGFNILPTGFEGGHYIENVFHEFTGLGWMSNIISSTFAGDTAKIWHVTASTFTEGMAESYRYHSLQKKKYYCVRCIKDCD